MNGALTEGYVAGSWDPSSDAGPWPLPYATSRESFPTAVFGHVGYAGSMFSKRVDYHFANMLSNASKVLNLLVVLCMVPLALAQFNFFEQMFGQGPPGGQHQQRRPPSHSQWAAQADAGAFREVGSNYPNAYS